jgi:hypothetical protein
VHCACPAAWPWRRSAAPARTACWPCSSSPHQTRPGLSWGTPLLACALCRVRKKRAAQDCMRCDVVDCVCAHVA